MATPVGKAAGPKPAPEPPLAAPVAGPPGGAGAPPGGPPALTPQRILINNEQVKLTANIINAVAGAFIIGGGAGVYAAFSASSDAATIGRTALWIAVGALVHLGARRMLRNLL